MKDGLVGDKNTAVATSSCEFEATGIRSVLSAEDVWYHAAGVDLLTANVNDDFNGAVLPDSRSVAISYDHDEHGLASALLGGLTVLELVPDFDVQGGDVIDLAMLFEEPQLGVLSQTVVEPVSHVAALSHHATDGGFRILYDDELVHSVNPHLP